ncbi:MAG TPA: amidohydrolase [Actinomycetota bacterium]|nr:amidohydrolase [Actinomycetota bacterium]
MGDLGDLRLRDFVPSRAVRAPRTELPPRPPSPIVDAHQHLGRWLTEGWSAPDVGRLLATMDDAGIAAIVNLDGLTGQLEENLERYDRAHPGRFATFTQLERSSFAAGDWVGLGKGVADAAAIGARGLKVWKDLGLHLRDPEDRLVGPDDPRLDPVWDACAAAAIPVTIHTADPAAFFAPLDPHNERVEELLEHPDWWFGDRGRFPTFERLLDQLEALIARRADVTFIGAHVLGCAEDLAWVSRILDTYPNANADIAARIAELGRVPRAARALLIRHAGRVVFGTDDVPVAPATYEIHRRFFETADECFDYAAEPVPPQGRWTIDGLDLPADALAELYGAAARRLIPGLAT